MALSDDGLPTGITARPLEESDLQAALMLSEEAGWNQVPADWRIFLKLGSAIGLTRGERLVATAASLPYGDVFGWISMVLVTAAERRQGLARRLLRDRVDHLLARNLVPVLDATAAGRNVYVGLGFRDCWTMRRLVGRTVRAPQVEGGAAAVRALEPGDWPQVAGYDRAVFGADRRTLLHSLAQRLPEAALVAERDGGIAGFLFGREGRIMNQLGPLAADARDIATSLLAQAITRVPGPLAIDVADRHAAMADWLTGLGFQVERPLTRMIYGASSGFHDRARLFAIAGPELG